MPIAITTTDLLREYIEGVMERANHHAFNVQEIVLTLAGAVMWKATEDIEVRAGKTNKTANSLWFSIDDRRYAFVYRHDPISCIELHERNERGIVLHTFDNTNTAADVKRIFDTL